MKNDLGPSGTSEKYLEAVGTITDLLQVQKKKLGPSGTSEKYLEAAGTISDLLAV